MSAPGCPRCGRAGKQTGRVHVAHAQVEITHGQERTVKATGYNIETRSYRCRGGHSWELASPGALNAAMQALFDGVRGDK